MDNTYTPVQLAGDPNNMLLLGHEHTRIEFNDSTNLWTLTDAKSIVSATSRSTKVSYVLGKHTWEVANDVYECHKGEPYTTQLKLTGCDQQGEFTCNDGQCVRMEERCDQLPNCRDESDEDNCQLLILKNNYNNKVHHNGQCHQLHHRARTRLHLHHPYEDCQHRGSESHDHS